MPDVPVATDGPDTPNGQRAFHLSAEGVGRLFAAVYKDPDPRFTDYWRDVAYVPKDGPLPEMGPSPSRARWKTSFTRA